MKQDKPGANPNGNTPVEKDLYFYHPDHLGSSSYITDTQGKLYEHLEYFPFGETWIEESTNTQRTPYLFTSKELDEETGLYYFGARYYDPRTSVWQSADPVLGEYLPNRLDERQLENNWDATRDLSGRGGIYNSPNINLYVYAHHNPVRWIDPRGYCLEDACIGEAIIVTAAVRAIIYVGSAALAAWGASAIQNSSSNSSGGGDDAKKAPQAQASSVAASPSMPPPEDPNKQDTNQQRTVSKTEDITKGRSIPNRQTDITKGEFIQNLEKSGFNRSVSKDGTVTNLEKGGMRYSIRDTSKSTGGPSVDVFKNGEMVLKYRLLPD